MNQAAQIIQSELFWLALTTAIGYAANSIVSRKVVSRISPKSPWRRAIRAIHGFLDKIDPIEPGDK